MGKDWADSVWWDQATRHGQILKYAARSSVSNWLALDDDVEGWASGDRDKLIATTPEKGISNMDTLIELRAKLILARR